MLFLLKKSALREFFKKKLKIRSFFDPFVRINSISLFPVTQAEGIDFSVESVELRNVLEEVQRNHMNFTKLSPRMQNNEKVILSAVQQDGWILEFASAELQNNEKVVLRRPRHYLTLTPVEVVK
jgi:hypothetical protein